MSDVMHMRCSAVYANGRAPRTPVTPLEIRVAYNGNKVILYMVAHKCQLSSKDHHRRTTTTSHHISKCSVVSIGGGRGQWLGGTMASA